ncbi:MAG: CBS domain-containing protein [Gammaproteobacteria bacterium]|nr:CBS domain-containing protein [Gammaproteobacteria bacterium]
MTYKPLELKSVGTRITYHRPSMIFESNITMDSLAYLVMTDLIKVTAVTIGANASISEANDRMIANGIRMLLVTDQQEMLQGLITATDLLGEKPLNYAREVGTNHNEISVKDIMTPLLQMEVLTLGEVLNSRVGDIVETMKRVGRQHALVVDGAGEHEAMRVRGIFSSTLISVLTGEEIDVAGKAGNFAELENALLHGH